MLLEFKFENYKSFVDETIFSLKPAPKIKDLSFSILSENIKGKKNVEKALCSAIVYGPNASGKTNIIGAIDTFKSIVSNGHIKNLPETGNNPAAATLELIPNNKIKKSKPVTFSIKFIDENLLIGYNLKIDLGSFLESSAERKILEESLMINDFEFFSRKENVSIGKKILKFKEYLNPAYNLLENFAEIIATDTLNPAELFLTNGFKTIFSSRLSQLITNWFNEKLVTIYNSSNYEANLTASSFGPERKGLFVQDDLENAARALGITSSHIGYICNEKNEMVLSSAFEREKEGFILPSEIIESVGTVRFLNFVYPLMCAIKNGGTLIIDEFDNSLHSMVIMNIINIFHNNEVNVNKAQLIFNSQNPIFLNSDLYRRDEIKFVEKDEDGFSNHYSLSDFILPNNKQVRKGADYMKNYFIDQYGAIKNIDLSPLFESIMKNKDFKIREMR